MNIDTIKGKLSTKTAKALAFGTMLSAASFGPVRAGLLSQEMIDNVNNHSSSTSSNVNSKPEYRYSMSKDDLINFDVEGDLNFRRLKWSTKKGDYLSNLKTVTNPWCSGEVNKLKTKFELQFLRKSYAKHLSDSELLSLQSNESEIYARTKVLEYDQTGSIFDSLRRQIQSDSKLNSFYEEERWSRTIENEKKIARGKNKDGEVLSTLVKLGLLLAVLYKFGKWASTPQGSSACYAAFKVEMNSIHDPAVRANRILVEQERCRKAGIKYTGPYF